MKLIYPSQLQNFKEANTSFKNKVKKARLLLQRAKPREVLKKLNRRRISNSRNYDLSSRRSTKSRSLKRNEHSMKKYMSFDSDRKNKSTKTIGNSKRKEKLSLRKSEYLTKNNSALRLDNKRGGLMMRKLKSLGLIMFEGSRKANHDLA